MREKEIDEIYEEDLALFPDIKTYLTELNYLANTDFSEFNETQIYNRYYDLAKILPTLFGYFNSEKINKQKYYRVRLKKTIGDNEDISLKQTFSYPPTSVLYQNGRANVKFKSVFYCSNNPNGAIIECKPEIGDEGFLSVWKGIAKRPLKAGICLPKNLTKDNVWNLVASESFEYLNQNFLKKAKDKYQHFEALYNFIADRFINESQPYPLTSMISNELLYGELWRDFILYPSIMAETKLCNLAFHPNSVNENLDLEKIIKFKIIDKHNNQLKFNLGNEVGFYENSKLIWNKITDTEKNLFKVEKTCS